MRTQVEQLQEYIDLLLAADKASPSDELHDRIERAIAELRREQNAHRQVVYDIPLRYGAPFVRLTLPVDLTDVEAEKLAGVLRSVAFKTEEAPAAKRRERSEPQEGS